MNNKKILYFFIEINYILLNLCLLIYTNTKYFSTVKYDVYVYSMLVISIAVLCLIFGPLIGKFFGSLIVFGFILYVSSQSNYHKIYGDYYKLNNISNVLYANVYLLFFAVLLLLIFVILYFIFQRKIFDKKIIKYRLLAPALFVFVIYAYSLQMKALKAEKHNYLYQVHKEPYYSFIHPFDNQEEFVENYGIVNYLFKNIEFHEKRKDNESSIEEITEYLSKKPYHTENEYTGIFDGKDLLVIQTPYLPESKDGSNYGILNSISKNSIIFPKYKKTLSVEGTTDIEIAINASLHPDSLKELSTYLYDSNYYPTTLAKVFNDAGYITDFYFKDWLTYYNRENLYKNFGYSNLFGKDSFANSESVGLYEMVDEFIYKRMITEENLMSYIVAGEETSFEDIERSINLLMKYDNNLVILLISENKGVPFIYSKDIQRIDSNKNTSTVDILPTICNLFGLKANYKDMIGNDIFDSNYSGYCIDYENKNIKTVKGDFKIGTESNDFLNDICKTIDISYKIQRCDYFSSK